MFRGVGTAIITPFINRIEGSVTKTEVDFNALEKFCEYQIENSVSALVVLGTTGEAPAIDHSERRQIVESVVRIANGCVSVIVGTGTNNTQHCIENNKMAEESGADGLLIVTPYYNKSTQKGLVRHFTHIAQETNLPIILYNVPSRTSVNLLPETVIEIYKANPNVIGVKEASGNISQIARLMAIKPNGLKVYSGNDDQALPIIGLGGDGCISVISNVLPSQFSALVDEALSGNYQEARRYQKMLIPMMNALFNEVNPIPVKYACFKEGYCENLLRLPLIEASKETQLLIDVQLERLGVAI
ncbi:MAG: 4-hydroxy-tetrahydrodipicolinate synthase [Thermotogota bacterium]